MGRGKTKKYSLNYENIFGIKQRRRKSTRERLKDAINRSHQCPKCGHMWED